MLNEQRWDSCWILFVDAFCVVVVRVLISGGASVGAERGRVRSTMVSWWFPSARGVAFAAGGSVMITATCYLCYLFQVRASNPRCSYSQETSEWQRSPVFVLSCRQSSSSGSVSLHHRYRSSTPFC